MKERTFVTIVAIVIIILGIIFIYYLKANLNSDDFEIPMPNN